MTGPESAFLLLLKSGVMDPARTNTAGVKLACTLITVGGDDQAVSDVLGQMVTKRGEVEFSMIATSALRTLAEIIALVVEPMKECADFDLHALARQKLDEINGSGV